MIQATDCCNARLQSLWYHHLPCPRPLDPQTLSRGGLARMQYRAGRMRCSAAGPFDSLISAWRHLGRIRCSRRDRWFGFLRERLWSERDVARSCAPGPVRPARPAGAPFSLLLTNSSASCSSLHPPSARSPLHPKACLSSAASSSFFQALCPSPAQARVLLFSSRLLTHPRPFSQSLRLGDLVPPFDFLALGFQLWSNIRSSLPFPRSPSLSTDPLEHLLHDRPDRSSPNVIEVVQHLSRAS